VSRAEPDVCVHRWVTQGRVGAVNHTVEDRVGHGGSPGTSCQCETGIWPATLVESHWWRSSMISSRSASC
jgi:hypothetical protein